jgi:sigma-B regulation protein RsbU (phosphoserine phosphatase)
LPTPDLPLPPGEALYEHAACGLLLTDKAGLVLRANATFCSWIGLAPAALVGKRRFQDLLTVGGRIFHQTHWAPLLQMQGSISEVKLDLQHAQGHVVPMVMNAVSREYQAQVVHELAVFVAEDRHAYERELLRARKQAEGLLGQQQDRATFAEQMVGIVSHDLRNPLSAISLASELLARLDPNPQQAAVIDGLGRSVRRARRLIDDLLDFTMARIGKGLPMAIGPLALHEAVSAHVRELALAHPGRVLLHERSGDGACQADGDRIFQLLGNLVANAVAYGAPDQPITIASEIGDDGCSLSVHNLGNPIPESLLPTLFLPMVRGDHRESGSRSVGLGLYIVGEIARAHGGTVEVQSIQGHGTRFVARFPN